MEAIKFNILYKVDKAICFDRALLKALNLEAILSQKLFQNIDHLKTEWQT